MSFVFGWLRTPRIWDAVTPETGLPFGWNDHEHLGAQSIEDFLEYVLSFYGDKGVYPMGATREQVIACTKERLDQDPGPHAPPCAQRFEGGRVDREVVRDLLIERYGLVYPPLTPLAVERAEVEERRRGVAASSPDFATTE